MGSELPSKCWVSDLQELELPRALDAGILLVLASLSREKRHLAGVEAREFAIYLTAYISCGGPVLPNIIGSGISKQWSPLPIFIQPVNEEWFLQF